jgi:hypothetical protein
MKSKIFNFQLPNPLQCIGGQERAKVEERALGAINYN